MRIGIIDADLECRKKHRFPNLACMKISGYFKAKRHETKLISFAEINSFDRVFCSKVFTDTITPALPKHVECGGTGFYFDKAPNLPDEIEHCMPDYNLYSTRDLQSKEYTDYSIGFLTRGCFRQCKFCVNQKYNRVFEHSPLSEFYDPSRKKVCLLDDNFLGFNGWRRLLLELINLKKPFKFKQGLDERLLTEEKCELLFSAKYDGDYTFAFDNVEDYELIESKLKMIRKYTQSKNIKFYVLCGFKNTDIEDIQGVFTRVQLLKRYNCLPYIMRYQSKDEAPWKNSEFRDMYTQLARYCNQPSMVRNMTFSQWVEADNKCAKTERASARTLIQFEKKHGKIPI